MFYYNYSYVKGVIVTAELDFAAITKRRKLTMKKLIVAVVVILGVVFSVKGCVNSQNYVQINYNRLAMPANDYGSMVILPMKKAFPQKTMNLIVEAIPEFKKPILQFQENLEELKSSGDRTFLTSDLPVLALRKAERVVDSNEYADMVQKVLDNIDSNLIEREEFYTLWKYNKRRCEALRKVIPADTEQFGMHVRMCYYLDDIEQIENYRNKREKEKDKDAEQYAQDSIQYMIGASFQSALIQMVEMEEAREQ